MKNFAHYDPTTGRILHAGSCAARDLPLQVRDGMEMLETAEPVDFDTHFVNGGNVVLRPSFPDFDKTTIRADGVDFAVLNGLPNDVKILVDGRPVTVLDGRLEFASDMAGVYTVQVEGFPYRPMTVEVEAT